MLARLVLYSLLSLWIIAWLSLVSTAFTGCHPSGNHEDHHELPPEDPRPRVIISSDLGGSDHDDHQSFVHALLMSDIFRIEGIVTSWKNGKASTAHHIIDLYAADYPNLTAHAPGYPTPDALHAVVRQGATAASPSAGWSTPTEGSALIIERALSPSQHPLNIVVWGSMTDVAQAIHDMPTIKPRIRVCSSGGWNTLQDRSARDYIRREHPDLHWVEQDDSGRGIYLTGLNGKSRYGNVGFVRDIAKPSGHLGRYYYDISEHINVNRYGMKMGDTPTLLFALFGSFENPAADSWGGRYCHSPNDPPNYWGDCKDKELRISGYNGAMTVAIHRQEILEDFEMRLGRTLGANSGR